MTNEITSKQFLHDQSASVAAIQFVLYGDGDDRIQWLRLWNEGDFSTCRAEWPEAPAECYIGADPLLTNGKQTFTCAVCDGPNTYDPESGVCKRCQDVEEQAPLVTPLASHPVDTMLVVSSETAGFERHNEPLRDALVEASHADDIAVDQFAIAMKTKLAEARLKGRSGWNDKQDCPQSRLSNMLRDHVEKGDPVDVANLCMFLQQRDQSILPKSKSPFDLSQENQTTTPAKAAEVFLIQVVKDDVVWQHYWYVPRWGDPVPMELDGTPYSINGIAHPEMGTYHVKGVHRNRTSACLYRGYASRLIHHKSAPQP